jgi:hypothetical protein
VTEPRAQSAAESRLGVTFHRTFALPRPSLSQCLRLAASRAAETGGKIGLDSNALRAETGLGTIYVDAMPRYAYGAGLLDQAYRPTLFGTNALANDPLLETSATQWLMHYHLSAPHGPGPAFWHDVVVSHFRPGQEFTSTDIAAHISDFIEGTEGRRLAERSVRSTATVLLGSYTKPDGLHRLGLLEELGEDRYRVLQPEPPPAAAFGCALVDFWQARYPGRVSVNLADLSAEAGIGNLFLAGAGRISAMLRELKSSGHVQLYLEAPPYQVVLMQSDASPMLEELYGTGSA